MREVPSWDVYFMDQAKHVSTRSKDPNTQVGAIVVNHNHDVIATGYNGFPPGCVDNDKLWERPTKYDRVIHAELNAIARAARRGHAIEWGIMYVTAFPCLPCAKAIIAAGIVTVYHGPCLHGWNEDHRKAKDLLNEAGVLTDDRSYMFPARGLKVDGC
jgi:dCMP deaminase